MSRIGVLLATGFEEIEAVTIIDVLRRAELDVIILGVDGDTICGAHSLATPSVEYLLALRITSSVFLKGICQIKFFIAPISLSLWLTYPSWTESIL